MQKNNIFSYHPYSLPFLAELPLSLQSNSQQDPSEKADLFSGIFSAFLYKNCYSSTIFGLRSNNFLKINETDSRWSAAAWAAMYEACRETTSWTLRMIHVIEMPSPKVPQR